MAAIASLIVRIGADDKAIQDALASVGVKARATDAELKKLGSTPLGASAAKSFESLKASMEGVTKAQQGLADRAANAARGLERVGGATKLTEQELTKIQRVLKNGQSAFEALGKSGEQAAKDVNKALAGVSQQLSKGFDFAGLASNLKTAGLGLTVGVTAPIVALGTASAKTAISFEQSFAAIKRTVDGTVNSLGQLTPKGAALRAEFSRLAETIPLTLEELSRIGALAGQLDVPIDKVVEFTSVMARLGVTTDLTAEGAALAIAKIQTIFGSVGADTDRFASTLLKLGVNSAATESSIVELATRIAGAGVQVGLTQGQVLAFAAAVSSAGVEAEAGGTAISRTFQELSKAVATGGAGLDQFARVAGLTGTQFAKLFRVDAAEALRVFLAGLAQVKNEGGNVFRVLEQLGLEDARLSRTLLATGEASGKLAELLKLQGEEWAANRELTRASEIQFATTENQLKLLNNSLRNVAAEFGTALTPAMKDLIDVARIAVGILAETARVFDGLPEPVKRTAITVLGVAAAMGPLSFAAGGAIQAVKSLQAALALLAGPALIAGIRGIGTAIAATAATSGAVGVLGATFSALAAALGPVLLTAGAIFAAYKGFDWAGVTDSVGRLLARWNGLTDAQYNATRAAVKAFESQKASGLAVDQTAASVQGLKDQLAGLTQAKGVQELDAAVRQLSESGQLNAKAMQVAAKMAQNLVDTGATLSPALQNIANAASRAGDAAKLGATGFDALREATKAAQKELDALSAKDRKTLAFEIGIGTSATELKSALGISTRAIDLFKTQLEASSAGAKKHQKALDEVMNSQKALTEAQKATIREMEKESFSVSVISEKTGATVTQIRELIETDKEALKSLKNLEPPIISLAFVFDALKNKVGSTEVEFIKAKLRFEEMQAAADDGTSALEKFGKTLPSFAPLTGEQAKQIQNMKRLRDGLKDLASAFSDLSQSSGGVFGSITREIGNFIGSLSLAIQGLDQFNDPFARFTQRLAGLASALAGFAQATSSKNPFAALIGGIGAGGALGETLGSSIGRLFGPLGQELGATIGKIAGPIIGALVGLFRSLRKSTAQKVAFDVGRDFGVSISEGLSKAIADASKTTGRQAATLLNLDKIIGEAGGVKEFGVDKAIRSTRDLFSLLAQGALSVQQVGKEFDALFGLIVPEAISKSTGLASAAFTELVKLARATRIPAPQVDDFIGAQLTTNVGGGLGSFFSTGSDAAKKQAELQTQLKDLQAQAAKATGDEQARLNQEIQKVNAALLTQQGIVQATSVTTQASATGFAAALVASFSELTRIGVPVGQAIQAIGPSVSALREQMAKAGLEGGEAFDRLLGIVTLAGDEVAGPVITAVGGLGQALAGLSNTGLLSQDVFAGLTSQVASSFASLTAQGKGGDEALRLIQPTLQTIFELQERFGFAVDESTQSMLDQAKAAGVIGSQFKSAGDRTADSLDRTNVILEAIANKLGAVVPEAAEKAAKGIEDALAKLPEGSKEAGGDVEGHLTDALDPAKYRLLFGEIGEDMRRVLAIQAREAAKAIDEELSRIVVDVQANLVVRNDFGSDGVILDASSPAIAGSQVDQLASVFSPPTVSLQTRSLLAFDTGTSAGVLRAPSPFVSGGQVLPLDTRTTAVSTSSPFTRQEAQGVSGGGQTIVNVTNDIRAWDGQSVIEATTRPGGVADILINSIARDERGRGTVLSRVVKGS